MLRVTCIRACNVLPRRRRKLSNYHGKTVEALLKSYEEKKLQCATSPVAINRCEEHAVFANNEMSLRYVDVYGFDYDYTLANYSDELHTALYGFARQQLIHKYGYPEALMNYNYDPQFPIRGLHFDTGRGNLMKLDSFSHVQFGTVYKGWRAVPDEEVIQEYSGTLIHVDKLSKGLKRTGNTIHQQMDLFCIPFLSLLANVIEYFIANNIHYDPGYVYHDVEKATYDIHVNGQLHNEIINNLERYLPRNPALQSYLEGLVAVNKKLFIITNSSFRIVDIGMTHLFGRDWRDLFDVVIVRARKPKFFTDSNGSPRPFRTIDPETGHYHWNQVLGFEKHGVYAEGNARLFAQFSQYEGPRVMYFGDHVYSDLMDPVLRYGWRTGAIIPELEREMEISNSEEYIRMVRWLLSLEELIQYAQFTNDAEIKKIALEWKQERKELRIQMKSVFNNYFGSMFRTFHNPSSFSRRMTRYADLYTSSVANMAHYSSDFHFFPRRLFLPHEQDYIHQNQEL